MIAAASFVFAGPAELLVVATLVAVPIVAGAIVLFFALRNRRTDLIRCGNCGKRMLATAETCSKCRQPLH